MLGIFGVMVLVLGGFSAGGAIFDWRFLFSDGYREYNWVRSAGREGARGMLLLFGGILVVAGFVAQVVDAASRTAGRGVGPDRFAQSADESPATREAASGSAAAPAVATPPAPSTTAPQVAGPTMGNLGSPTNAGTVATSATTAPKPAMASAVPAWQPLTIFEPEVIPQESDTFLTLKYRFEEGHRPLAGHHYVWVIDVLGVTKEIEYEAEAMRQEGQLTHLERTPYMQSGFDRHWSTSIAVEFNGRRRQSSNALQIVPGEEVRSLAPPQPR